MRMSKNKKYQDKRQIKVSVALVKAQRSKVVQNEECHIEEKSPALRDAHRLRSKITRNVPSAGRQSKPSDDDLSITFITLHFILTTDIPYVSGSVCGSSNRVPLDRNPPPAF